MAEMFAGLLGALAPVNLIFVFIGTFVGIIIGALPGLGATTGIAVLIPLTFGMEPSKALLLAAGIYQGAIYGGSITAVLLGIPGTPTNTATCFDGYPLSRKGRSYEALGASMTASAIGGLISCILLLLLTQPISRLVLYFGAPEQFMMAMVGLSVIAASSGESLGKGLLSGFFGLAVASIGYDAITGYDRFTFGSDFLVDGLEFMVIAVGMFGLSQAILLAEEARTIAGDTKLSGSLFDGVKAVFKYWKITLYCSGLGAVLGITPGAGGSAACMLAYSSTQNSADDKDTFGDGNIKGVIAPEAANNATIGTAIIPTLAFGIPGSPTAAVLMGLLMIHNIIPGPRLFTDHSEALYIFFWGLVFTCFALVIIGLPLLKFFAKITVVPYQILVPAITIFCCIGAFSSRGYLFDIFVMIFFAFIGYFLKKAKYPLVCFVLGLILGPTAETNLMRSLMIYGDLSFVYIRPITLALLILLVIVIASSFVKKFKKAKTK